MKYLVKYMLISLLSVSTGASEVNPILRCIGSEESRIHNQRISGPLEELNQKIIRYLTPANNIKVKSKYLQKICKNQTYSPSLSLLREVIIHQKKVFLIPKNVNKNKQVLNEVNNIEIFIEDSSKLFINFLSKLQLMLPTPYCLEKSIPELTTLFNRLKYLENISHEDFGKDNQKLILIIFDKLKNFDNFYKHCENENKS